MVRSFYYITNLLLHVILVSYIQRILIKQAKLRPETLSMLKTKDNNGADKTDYLNRKNVLVQWKYLQKFRNNRVCFQTNVITYLWRIALSEQNPVFIPGPPKIPDVLRKACDIGTMDHRSAKLQGKFFASDIWGV